MGFKHSPYPFAVVNSEISVQFFDCERSCEGGITDDFNFVDGFTPGSDVESWRFTTLCVIVSAISLSL